MQTGPALVVMLAIGGAIGLGLPMPGGTLSQIAEDAQPFVEPVRGKVGETAPRSGWAQDLTLERQSDGHFYAEVMVDGLPTMMLVDTGASTIALTGQDATDLGLFWDGAEVSQVAQGASGPVYGVRTVLPRVAIGGFEADNVTAMIVPEGLRVSLLGQSFLSQIDSVQISADQMTLSNQTAPIGTARR